MANERPFSIKYTITAVVLAFGLLYGYLHFSTNDSQQAVEPEKPSQQQQTEVKPNTSFDPGNPIGIISVCCLAPLGATALAMWQSTRKHRN